MENANYWREVAERLALAAAQADDQLAAQRRAATIHSWLSLAGWTAFTAVLVAWLVADAGMPTC